MNSLLRCVTCSYELSKEHEEPKSVFITNDRIQIKMHERKYHSYNHAQYEHKNHINLTKEEKARIIEQGEKRLGLQYFFGHEQIKSAFEPKIEAAEIQYYHGPNETVK